MVSSLPISVAVLGSCATRDVFNRNFCPDYPKFFKCVTSQLQGSLMSVLSEPFDLPDQDLAGLNAASARDVRSETKRELRKQLSIQQPEYLIVDMFGDVRFGIAKLKNGAIVTRNEWKLAKTQYYKNNVAEELFPRNEEFFHKWCEAAQATRSHIRRVSPKTRIILHDVEFVKEFRKSDGTITKLPGEEYFETLNRWWRRLNTYFAENIADDVIRVRNEATFSFEEHPWGSYGVHHELNYHARFLTQLTQIALQHSRAREKSTDATFQYRL